MDRSLPGSSILQARVLEWGAIAFSDCIYIYTQRHKGILFSHEKEANLAICENMDEPGAHYAKWNKPGRERQKLHGTTYLLPSHFHSCLTLCNTIDGSPPGSPVLEILQARTLEWVAIPSPMHESEKWKWSQCHARLLATPWTAAYQAPLSMGFSRQEYGSGVPLPSLVPLIYGILKIIFFKLRNRE